MTRYEERLEKDLEAIHQKVADVGRMVDRAIEDATKAMLERDKPLASMTILRDLPVNRASRSIDRACHRFVARHFPSAGFLRTISAVLRISTALERIGDYAVSVSKGAVQVVEHPSSVVTKDVEMMGEQARQMLSRSLEAFRERDVELARTTMAMESQADKVYRVVFRDLLTESSRSGADVRDLFALLNTFNRLERITDQAKNICEQTLFAVTGEEKPPKSVRVLFVDTGTSDAGIMAEAIARKAYPETGKFDSEAWDPADTFDPALVDFLERNGLTLPDARPRAFDSAFDVIRGYLAVVALAPGIMDHIPELPWSAVVLDWSDEVHALGDPASRDDESREALYKLLASKIPDLMDILSGERD